MATPDGFILVRAPVAGARDEKQVTSSLLSKAEEDGKAKPTTGATPAALASAEAAMKLKKSVAAPSLSLHAMFGKPRRRQHAKHGLLDVYTVVLTTASGATSDASGNLPGYFNAGGQLVNSGSWSTLVTMFDIVRLEKVVHKFYPKLGWKTARSFTPLTATALNMVRVAVDPEGALSSPTTANMLARAPAKRPYEVADHSLVDPFSVTYRPSKPIVRFSATALTASTMHDWMDVGDVNSYAANGTLVGGIVWNVVQAGACPASTDIFGTCLEYHCEFALRNG